MPARRSLHTPAVKPGAPGRVRSARPSNPGSHVFTTRTDRLVSILSFFVSLAIVLAIAGIVFGGAVGPIELVIAIVIAIPLTIVLSRWLRTVVERRSRPA
jgi:hypothetical protein